MRPFVFSLAAIIICTLAGNSQSFPPAAGLPGSTAIHKDDNRFTAWADSIHITRGPTDIRQSEAEPASYGEAADALGKADGKVVSLGDGGQAVLYFQKPITNGNGPDFVIFENGLRQDSTDYEAFLELAFAEVSSDGKNFYRFPALCELSPENPISTYGTMDARYIRNLAGKYSLNYGTPFDLEELAHFAPELNINAIHYIKIIDVIGSSDEAYATYDSKGNIVLDPFPTPFVSGGFDLDAVGLINQKTAEPETKKISLMNPTPSGILYITKKLPDSGTLYLYSPEGGTVHSEKLPREAFSVKINANLKGFHIVRFETKDDVFTTKIIIH